MRFINPYNFVPLAEGAPSPAVKGPEDYTGFIEYDLYTKTPLFIPNTSNSDTFDVPGKVKDHKSFEFFSYQDLTGKTLKMDSSGPEEPVIPGSEVRGMFRSNYEILTNSCLSIVDEDKDVVLAKRTNEVFKAGLIRKDGINSYSLHEAKDCLLRTDGANSLRDKKPFDKYRDWKNKSYEHDRKKLPEGAKVHFFEQERFEYQFNGRKKVYKSLALKVRKFGSPADPQAVDVGYLIKGEPGPEMGNMQEKHCGHVFKYTGTQVRGKFSLHVLDTALAQYESSSGRYGEYAEELRTFKESAAVGEFFPVYYSKIPGSQYIYLSPACMTREIYQKKMSELLGKYAPCNNKVSLCPACSLFGTVGKDKKRKMFNVASRVRFTDLHLKEDAKAEYMQVVTMKELSSPKLSNTEFYLKRPSKDAWFWTYDYYVDDKGQVHTCNMEINGRKFYWHRKKADLPDKVEITERNTTVRPLKEGALFTGRVYFEHISKTELDRLIFLVNTGDALALEDDNYIKEKSHGFKLGAGKPLGLGSIATSVRAIEIRKVSLDSASITWTNELYVDYDQEKVGIADDIKENFNCLTDFNAVVNSEELMYPTTGKPGNDGKIHIFDWYTQNHVGYRTKNNELIENGMPNSRTQMAFDQYMIPMQTDLGQTTYRNVVKKRDSDRFHNGPGGRKGGGGQNGRGRQNGSERNHN